MDWSVVLFILKWIFLGIVYLVIFLLLIAVQREMRMRLPAPQSSVATFGRLRVLAPGSDNRLRPGLLLALQPETNLGSQTDNDVVLLDRYVSGHHARLRWDGVSWWFEDLNSTNGTFINQQRIPPGGSQVVQTGAVLGVGDVSFEMVE
jgi:hypothetical protein